MNAPHRLLSTDHYTEGVVVDRDGTIFFSMTGIGTISRFAPGDAAAVVWAHVPAANGHAIDVDGTHVVMSSTVIAIDHALAGLTGPLIRTASEIAR